MTYTLSLTNFQNKKYCTSVSTLETILVKFFYCPLTSNHLTKTSPTYSFAQLLRGGEGLQHTLDVKWVKAVKISCQHWLGILFPDSSLYRSILNNKAQYYSSTWKTDPNVNTIWFIHLLLITMLWFSVCTNTHSMCLLTWPDN